MSDKVDDLIENIDNENHNGDYTAININDIQDKISLCGVGGNDDDFIRWEDLEKAGIMKPSHVILYLDHCYSA